MERFFTLFFAVSVVANFLAMAFLVIGFLVAAGIAFTVGMVAFGLLTTVFILSL